MKRSIRRWLGLAVVPAALALFGAVAPAQAASYDCDGGPNPVPSSTTGSIEITVTSGDCTIGHDVEAGSDIIINIVNGSLDAKKLTSKTSQIKIVSRIGNSKTLDLTAGTFIEIQAGLDPSAAMGDVEIQGPLTINATEMQDDNPASHGNILIRARGNVKTMDISTGGNFPAGGKKTGGVQIDAHVFATGGIPVFTIGADTVNGINGVISTETVSGGGTSGTGTILGGIRITNGAAGATGGIKVEKMNKIKVQGSASRSGWIQLIAQEGTLTLPTNKLNADGMNGNMAGAIFLAAKYIDTVDGTVISASQDEATSGSIHQVVIAAQEIRYVGADGLKIKADGNGVSENPFNPATVYVVPKGGISPTSTNTVQSLLWKIPFTGGPSQFFKFDGEVNFVGTTQAPLLISVNGDHTQLAITGYPIRFFGGNVDIRARGKVDHQIVMGYFGTYTGKNGFSTDVVGDVKINANGKDGPGGRIQIQVDQATLKALPGGGSGPEDPAFGGTFKITADGRDPDENGNGDGGQIIFTATQVTLDGNTKGRISADAKGVGNAFSNSLTADFPHAVAFYPQASNIILGNGGGRFKITATGGDVSGNGGSIKLASSVVEFRNSEDAIDVSAKGDSGNGGQVEVLSASSTLFHQNQDNPSQPVKTVINASGGLLSGNGGFIEIPDGKTNQPTAGTPVLNVNALMAVDGGTTEAAGSPFGRIKLNNVDCQQFVSAAAPAWPRTFWTCDGASGASSSMFDNANSLNQALKDQLGNLASLTEDNPEVQIYGFPDESKFAKYFTSAQTTNAIGVSLQSIRVSSVLTPALSYPLTGPGTGTHELAHQFDYIWGNASNSQTFKDAYNADVAAFNALNCLNAFPQGLQGVCGLQISNIERLQQELITFTEPEAFAHMFEHVNSGTYNADLETVLDKFANMKSYMQMNSISPPPAQQ